jgi:hypothetical protein
MPQFLVWFYYIRGDGGGLGSATCRKTMNYAYCAVYLDQEKAARLNPPALFIIAVGEVPPQSYRLAEMAEKS